MTIHSAEYSVWLCLITHVFLPFFISPVGTVMHNLYCAVMSENFSPVEAEENFVSVTKEPVM